MSETIEANLGRADALLAAGNRYGALDAFRAVLAEAPEHLHALTGAAECLIAEDPLEAGRFANRALAIDPDNVTALCIKAIAASNHGSPSRGKELARRAIELSPFNPIAYRALGICCSHFEKDWKEGEEALRKAVEMAPEDSLCRADLARVLISRGKFRAAGELLDDALKLNPNDPDTIAARADLAVLNGSHKLARELVANALRLDPEHPVARRALVHLKVRTNPIMGIWWRWAAMCDWTARYNVQWLLRITAFWGVLIASGFLAATLMSGVNAMMGDTLSSETLGSASLIIALSLAGGFIVLTWVGPSVYNRMIRKEAEKIELHADF